MASFWKIEVNGIEYAVRSDMLDSLVSDIILCAINESSCRIISPFCDCAINKSVKNMVKIVEAQRFDLFFAEIIKAGIDINDVFKYLINGRKIKS